MASPIISSLKLREFSLLADSPNTFSEAFLHFGGQAVGSELFDSSDENEEAPSYESLLSGTTEGLLHDALSRADLIHLAAAQGFDRLFENANTLINRMLPITFPRDNRHILVDLTSLGKEDNPAQIQQILEMVTVLQTHAPVTLLVTPETLPDPDVKISHLRQDLTVAEILLYSESSLSSATNRGFESISLDSFSFSPPDLPVLLAAYAACQFLNVEPASRLNLAAIAANLYHSSKTFPSWVEIQS